MKTIAMAFIIALFGFTSLLADISNYYSFVPSTGLYIPITGTAIPSAIGDDALSEAVNIGFSFNYGENHYTQVKVSSNGFVALGTTTNAAQTNSLSTTSYCPLLAPLWDDLNTTNGQVQYLLEGVPASRVLTIQYSGVNWNRLSSNVFDFQVKLYENEKVEFIYGSATGIPTEASASIGINMRDGVMPGASYWSVTPGPPPTASGFQPNNAVSQWPGNGTIYTFAPIPGAQYDLEAQTITGNPAPILGEVENYAVTIYNCGTISQDYYDVKLMSGSTVLAMVSGPLILPNETLAVQIPWTPGQTGNYRLYGKVSLIGDSNHWNDVSDSLDVIVHNADTTLVNIGEGNQYAHFPVNMYANCSLFETIYQASEINTAGVITGVAFYNSFIYSHLDMPVKIWLGMTALSDLSSGWIPSTQLVPVFDGTVDFPAGENIIEIQFSTPFPYAGANLVMLVNRPFDTQSYDLHDSFHCQTVGTNRSREAASYTTSIDPAVPPLSNNTITGKFPQTTLYMTAAGVTPCLGVAPESYSFNTTLMNQTASQSFVIYNTGADSLVINAISLSDSTMFHLQNLPALPYTLSGGHSATFAVQYAPTTGGNHTSIISLTDNLSRVVHTVPLNGNSLDPYIYASPYTQNFDSVTIPALPMDWSCFVQSTSTGAGVKTIGDTPHSPPNCAILANSSDINATLLLIAPPLAANLNMNGMRVKFGAKGYYLSHLQVGIMTDKTDAGTFVLQEELQLYEWWTDYLVSFLTYPGNGSYIAFRFVPGIVNTPIRIDDVIIESLSQADLGTLSFSGPYFPAVGVASDYTVGVRNWGNQPQGSYQVKLYNADDQEITAINGPVIPAGAQAEIVIPWTPATPGDTYIYAKIVLPGDQNSQNNQTNDYPVSVQPLGHIVTTVGEGLSVASMPINFNNKNSLNETIYLQSNLNFYGTITGISIYNDFNRTFTAMPTKIWMGSTELDSLTGGWIPSTELTQVFDGTMDYPYGTNLIRFDFSTPYQYLEGNLVVMFNRPWDIYHYESGHVFLVDNVGYDVSRQITSNTQTINPAAPGNTGVPLHSFYKASFYAIPRGLGNLSGTVFGNDNLPLAAASVAIAEGSQTTTDETGHYSFADYFSGTYSVTCTAPGYHPQTQNNLVIETGQTTLLDFYLQPVATEDPCAIAVTALRGNNPNPFHTQTSITYSVKEISPVKVEIYNLKGQLVKTMVKAQQAKGTYSISWNGLDDNDKVVSSGIYYYKMTAGKYSSTRKMILLK